MADQLNWTDSTKWGFPGGSAVKNSLAEVARVQSQGQEYPQEKEMTTHASILVREIPRTDHNKQVTVHGILQNTGVGSLSLL